MLESTVRRIERHLRRRGLLGIDEDDTDPDVPGDPESNLAASAVSGQTPPAGPQWVSRLAPLEPHDLAYDKPLCASLDGFTLHAATRAGAFHPAGREALLRYVLRPPIAQERLEPRPDGLVRITLKKAYTDGTVAVDMDPLSLLLPPGHQRASATLPHRALRGQTSPASWPRWVRRPRCPAAHRRAVPRSGRAACSAARRSVTKTTLRAAGSRTPRSGGREWGTGHGPAEPAPRAGSRPPRILP